MNPPKLDATQPFASKLNSKMGKILISSAILIIVILGAIVYIIEARPGSSDSSVAQPDINETTASPSSDSSANESNNNNEGNNSLDFEKAKNRSVVIVNKGKLEFFERKE